MTERPMRTQAHKRKSDIMLQLRFHFVEVEKDGERAMMVTRFIRNRTTDGIWGVWRQTGPPRTWFPDEDRIEFTAHFDRGFVDRIHKGLVRD